MTNLFLEVSQCTSMVDIHFHKPWIRFYFHTQSPALAHPSFLQNPSAKHLHIPPPPLPSA